MLILKDNGDAWSYGGANSYGQLGIGLGSFVSSPTKVFGEFQPGVMRFSQVTFDGALLSDGSAWTWGYGAKLGINDGTAFRSSPVSVVGNHIFTYLTGSGGNFYGLKSNNGTVWSWGSGYLGRNGDNTTTDRSSPVSVVGNHSFIQIASGMGDNTAGLKADGTMWCWGGDYAGALGDMGAFNTSKSSPVSVVGNHNFIRIGVGYHFGAGIKADGSCWCWGGYVSNCSCGDNTFIQRSSPVSVVGNHSFIDVTGSYYAMAGLKADGSIWTWGNAGSGILGDNANVGRSSPVSVVGNHSFIGVRGVGHSTGGTFYALKANGEVWSWGQDYYSALGQIGPGTGAYFGVNRSSPVSVVGDRSFAQLANGATDGYSHPYLLDGDGSLWGWSFGGWFGSFALGTRGMDGTFSPVKVVGNHKFIKVYTSGAGEEYQKSAAGMKADGSVWMWGDGSFGGRGDLRGDSRYESSPISVVGNHSFIDIRFQPQAVTLGLKEGGELWVWGQGYYGLGDGTNTNKSSPVSIVGNHSFSKIIVGKMYGSYHRAAMKADGSVWTWGFNQYEGGLGDGTIQNRSSPTSVIGGHLFVNVIQVDESYAGLKSNGTVWTWGANDYGQLGDDSIIERSSPVSVVGAHSFTDIFCYAFPTTIHAIKSDGTMWAWGSGTSGQLGNNSNTHRSSPVSVVGNHTFLKFDGKFGWKAGGELWTWGENGAAQLGDGQTASHRSSPVRVVGNHSFKEVHYASYGNSANCWARKEDGSIWAWGTWGYSSYGGSFYQYYRASSPQLVIGTNTFWNDTVIFDNNNTGKIGFGD